MSDRLDREIEEILRKSGSPPPRRLPTGRFRRMARRWKLGFGYYASWLRMTPTSVMVMSLVLLGLSMFLRMAFRQLAFYLAVLAIVLFFTAIVMSARQTGGFSYERRWRGQLIDLPSNSPLRALQDWLRQKQRRIHRWLDTR